MEAPTSKLSRISLLRSLMDKLGDVLTQQPRAELYRSFSRDEVRDMIEKEGLSLDEIVVISPDILESLKPLPHIMNPSFEIPQIGIYRSDYTSRDGVMKLCRLLDTAIKEMERTPGEGICPRCLERESIVWRSLCKICHAELMANHFPNPLIPDSFVLLCVSHLNSQEAFNLMAKKLGVPIIGDNLVPDIYHDIDLNKIRLFVDARQLPIAKSFLDHVDEVAKTRGESVEETISVATVSAAYIDWVPPSK